MNFVFDVIGHMHACMVNAGESVCVCVFVWVRTQVEEFRGSYTSMSICYIKLIRRRYIVLVSC